MSIRVGYLLGASLLLRQKATSFRSIYSSLHIGNSDDSNSLRGKSFQNMTHKQSEPYKSLCTEYYELDKPHAPPDILSIYQQYSAEAQGPILEPMCGSGRYMVPLLQAGYSITGFDSSSHMLAICRQKCQNAALSASLHLATFNNYNPTHRFNLVFIPAGSFCLLTSQDQASQALSSIHQYLEKKGKFVFEVDTLKAVNEPQGVWKGSWLNKSDGGKLVMSTLSRFDAKSRIDTTLCRYELWENNQIARTEVEDFQVRLYAPSEIEEMLKRHSFKVENKWLPHKKVAPDDTTETILYECTRE